MAKPLELRPKEYPKGPSLLLGVNELKENTGMSTPTTPARVWLSWKARQRTDLDSKPEDGFR